ncbi:MFS transporter [Streptacidiphilus sp. MAP5-52]|uniref:MFS transporter n=1 Tax=Streptacidiphilus sp. MAP5-52 TaxID=3156267 RepID=UPI00351538AF
MWRDPAFARYGTAQVLSTTGGAVSVVALPVVAAVDLHASTFQVALLAACSRLPPLLLSLPAGALIDRYPKRPVLLVCEATAGLVLATIPLTSLVAEPTLVQLYAVAFLVSSLQLVGSTASIAYLPHLVGPDRLVEANSRLGAGNSAADLIGSNISGLLTAAVGAARAVGADCLTYVASALLLTGIRHPEPASATRHDRSLRGDIRDGLTYVWREPTLRPVILANTVTASAMAASAALFTLYTLRHLHWTPTVLGLVFGAGGAGGILGGLLARRLSQRDPARTVLTCLALAPVCQLPVVLVTPGPAGQLLVALAMALQCASAVAGGSILRSLRQIITPPERQGRTQAAATWLSFGLRPAAALAAGATATLIGLRPTLALTALLLTIPVAMLRGTPLHRLRQLPTHADPAASTGPADLSVRGTGSTQSEENTL